MKNIKNAVGLFAVCCISILGIGLFSLPTAGAHFGSTFYWGYLLAGGLLVLCGVLLCTAKRTAVGYAAFQKSHPKGARFLSILYILFYTAIAAFIFAYYTHTVQGWFLNSVQRFFLALFLVAVCLTIAAKPQKTLLRLLGFLAWFVLFAVSAMRLVMLLQGDVRHLQPFFEAETTTSLPSGTLFIAAFFVLLGFLPCTTENRRIKRIAAGSAVLVCTALFICATAGCISLLGPWQTAQYLNSTVLAMKSLQPAQTDLLQRADLVFILTWSVLLLCAGALCAHIPLHHLFKAYPKLKSGWLCAAFGVVYTITALCVPSEENALLCLIYTAMPGGILFFFLLPLLLQFYARRHRP